ncbi:MAG: SCO family protein [Rickettsiales bacterium]
MRIPFKLTVISLFAAIAAGGILLFSQPGETNAQEGRADIGGNFTLTDSNGNAYSSDALLGQYSLVFFGFTHCPDMCPTGLTTITDALDALPEGLLEQITPVFITVDPKRDTPERMAKYATHFHPKLVSLTGSEDAIQSVAKAYKAFYKSAQTSDDQKDYMVNHSGFIYLMGPKGHYRKHFAHNADPDEMAKTIAEVMTGH